MQKRINVPLALAAFGGAVLIGGAILARPGPRPAPPRAEEPAVATPPPRDEPVGGGPPPIDDRPVASSPSTSALRAPPARSDDLEAQTRPPSSAGAPVFSAPPVTRVDNQTTATSETVVESAPAAPPSESASAVPSASIAPSASASGNFDPNAPYVLPTFGVPASSGSNQPPIANAGATGVSGGGGGGGASTSTSSSAITAKLLVPMNEVAIPATFFSSVQTHLRAGDVVVATVTKDASVDTFTGWSERARADAPDVGYGVALDRPAQVDAAIAKLPAALGTLGLSHTDGLDDATVARLSTRVRAAGRRFFVSVDVPTRGPSLATVGARADLVELVPSAVDVAALRDAAGALGTKAVVYVRLPSGSDVAGATSSITQAIPTAGVALPWSNDLSTAMADYRP